MQIIISYSPLFSSHARNEIFRDTTATRFNELAPGIAEVELPESFDTTARQWLKRPPIYLHHCFPVLTRYRTTIPPYPLQESLTLLRSCVAKHALACLKPNRSFAVQVRIIADLPHSYRERFGGSLERFVQEKRGLVPDRHRPQQILSVLITNESVIAGISPRRWNLSPWSGGMPMFAFDNERINRAEMKMLEAWDVFGIKYTPGSALDLGSGAGGWSRVLIQLGYRVCAVDPKLPSEIIASHPKLEHHATTAEDFSKEASDRQFDLLTNDMILHPCDSAEIMCEYAPCLRAGSIAIMTLKVGKLNRLQSMDHALRILRREFRIPRVKQLFFNRNEVSCWLIRK